MEPDEITLLYDQIIPRLAPHVSVKRFVTTDGTHQFEALAYDHSPIASSTADTYLGALRELAALLGVGSAVAPVAPPVEAVTPEEAAPAAESVTAPASQPAVSEAPEAPEVSAAHDGPIADAAPPADEASA